MINKAGFQIDKDFEFSLSWKYDGQFIYQNQRIGYKISDSGVLPDQSATILILQISSKQKQIVETMTQEEKMSLEMSDLKVNQWGRDRSIMRGYPFYTRSPFSTFFLVL